MTHSSRWIAALFFTVCAASLAMAQEQQPSETPTPYTDIPGTPVSLQIPSGFSVSKEFPGLVQPDLDVVIAVNQIEIPIAEVKAQMTEQSLADHNAKLLGTEAATIGGKQGLLVHISQTEEQSTTNKWLLLFGDDSGTMMIAASAPPEVDESMGDKLRAVLVGAKYDTAKKVDHFYGLGFTMRESTMLEIRGRMAGGVLMTRKGAPDELTPEEPILVVLPSQEIAIGPLPAFAKQQLTDTDQFSGFANFDEAPVTINGVAAYRIIADAKATEGDVPVRIYFVMFHSGDRELMLEGVVTVAAWERYMPEFRGMAESFRLTEAPPPPDDTGR